MLKSCLTLLDGESHISADEGSTSSRTRFGSSTPSGKNALFTGFHRSLIFARSSTKRAVPVTETYRLSSGAAYARFIWSLCRMLFALSESLAVKNQMPPVKSVSWVYMGRDCSSPDALRVVSIATRTSCTFSHNSARVLLRSFIQASRLACHREVSDGLRCA